MVCAVKGSSTNLYSMVGSLDDRILLRMEASAEFMPLSGRDALFLAKATDVKAVLQSGWCPVVSGGQNLFVFHEEGTYLSSQAGGALSHKVGDIDKIFFPRGSGRTNLFFLFLFQGRAIKKDGRA
jgi:hypothetical protein